MQHFYVVKNKIWDCFLHSLMNISSIVPWWKKIKHQWKKIMEICKRSIWNSLKLYRIIIKSTHIFRSMAYFGNEKLLDALIPNQIYLAVANIYRVAFIRLKLLRITAILPRYSISKKKSINKRLLSSSTCVYYKNMKDFNFVWEVNQKNEI